MEKITLELECKMTSKELQEKGQTMAAKVLEYDEYKKEKKAIDADLTEKMNTLHGELSALAKVTKSKHEVRSVECSVELDTPETGTKRITRLDTNAVIKESPMTMAERQTNLFSGSVEELNKLFNTPSDEPPPEQPAA